MKNNIINNKFYTDIKSILDEARHKTFKSINFFMVDTYWNIGKRIVEEEQKGEQKAEYGAYLLRNLSKFLSAEFGQGFSEQSLRNMRQFYLLFPIRSTVWSELTWSHYKLLIRIENLKARDWYATECIANNWSVRALERQISSLYYERLLSSTDRPPVLKEAEEKTKVLQTGIKDYIRDPYILDFLNLPSMAVLESTIEQALIDNLQKFLLEFKVDPLSRPFLQ